eukprot:scaffold6147_cov126-Amphora_coffeaeformis.AAC.2
MMPKKIALIGIKGTSTFRDIITVTCSFSFPYELPRAPLVEGKGKVIRVHEGMMFAAQQLGEEKILSHGGRTISFQLISRPH